MILMNKQNNKFQCPGFNFQVLSNQKIFTGRCSPAICNLQGATRFLLLVFWFLSLVIFFPSCGVYTFKDVSIPPEVKTVKINFIENRAGYKNPQLSPRITDQLQQKISNQTRLTRTNSDDAHYQISGYISSYTVSTSGISDKQAATNRLTVGVHITLLNTLKNETKEYDISRDFEFSAGLTFTQAEAQLMDDIVKNVTDEIFNRIFSNW
jgi:Lipopolysaccharide-assembly